MSTIAKYKISFPDLADYLKGLVEGLTCKTISICSIMPNISSVS